VLHADRIPAHLMRHSTEKPAAIMLPLVEASCPPGGTVLDPCAGTGPVVEACERLGRTCIAVEINPDFCDAIERRMNKPQLELMA
jgi:site-specific DNA-methyltransferase (adenine-specific)